MATCIPTLALPSNLFLAPPLGLGYLAYEIEKLVQLTLKNPSNDPSDVTLEATAVGRYLR
jgi:hypothetical protein